MPIRNNKKYESFDPAAFLSSTGLGRKVIELEPKQTFFAQGDPADSIFYLQSGRAKLTVVSQFGKEATITLLSAGDFVGEESLATVAGVRLSTATAVNTCSALKIGKDEMIRVMHEQHALSDMFLAFLLARSMRTQADLVDQLFNSSEKRLARTRSRVSFFMNRFRKLGFISYNGRIEVHKSLLNVVLLDQLPEHNSEQPTVAAD